MEAWHLPEPEIKKMSVGRRKRALRWKRRYDEHVEKKAKSKEGTDPTYDESEVITYIWRAPLGALIE